MNHPPEAYRAVERELREQLAEHGDALMKLRPVLLRLIALDCADGTAASAALDLMASARIDRSTREDDARDVATAERDVAQMLQDADTDEGECEDMRAEHGTYFTASGVRAA